MARYYVEIKNELKDLFSIEANSLEEAEEKAKRANSILHADSKIIKYLECGEKEKAFHFGSIIRSEVYSSYDVSLF